MGMNFFHWNMKGKKATIEIQFNWVFVLIIGGIILGFFGAMVYQQRNVSESKATQEILSDFDALISGSYASSNVIDFIETPDVEFKFAYPDYLVGGQRRQLKGRFVFAPSSFSGDFLVFLTKTWNLGFDIANFLYITSPEVRYYLIAGDYEDFAYEINNSIYKKVDEGEEQNLVRMTFLTDSAPEDKGYKKTRFVYFGELDPETELNDLLYNLEDKPSGDVTLLKVVPDSHSPSGYGKLQFFKKNSKNRFVADGQALPYLGEELLIGAIFVDNHEAYNYLLGKAISRLEIVSRIQELRLKELNEDEHDELDDSSCVYPDTLFSQVIEEIKHYNYKDGKDADNLKPLATTIPSSLEDSFENLLYAGCPRPY